MSELSHRARQIVGTIDQGIGRVDAVTYKTADCPIPPDMTPDVILSRIQSYSNTARNLIASTRTRLESGEVAQMGISNLTAIGESIIQLRHILAMARAMQSPVEIRLSSELRAIEDYIERPSQATFDVGESDSTLSLSFIDFAFFGLKLQPTLSAGPPCNSFDLAAYYYTKALGIDIAYHDILRSPLVLKPQDQDVLHNPDYDLVIAPGGLFLKAKDKSRSVKSLDPRVWGEVFGHVRRATRGPIAVIADKSNPRYSETVAQCGQDAGVDVQHVECPTLAEVIQVVLRGRRYIGGDTAVTHLAAQIVAAASQQFDIRMPFRQIYNGQAVEEHAWRVVTGDIDGKVLVYKGLNRSGPFEKSDISNLPPKLIADFILS